MDEIIKKNSLILGDCLEIMKNIENCSIDMILTDLPYTYEGKKRVTNCIWDSPIDLDILWRNYLRILKKNSVIVLTATNPFSSYLVNKFINYYKYEWIWEKNNGSNFVSIKHQPFRVHEHILIFGEGATTFNKKNIYLKYFPQFNYGSPYKITRDLDRDYLAVKNGKNKIYTTNNLDGKRYPKSILKFNLERGLHPTQKPVKLFEYLIKTYTNEGDLVLDNCSGSGTTAIACLNTNRKFILIEKEKKYFDISKKRILEKKEELKNANG